MQLHPPYRHGLLILLGIMLTPTAFNADAGTPTALITYSNTWTYNDESIDLGSAWVAPSYNDGTWSNGVAFLGFRSLNNTNYQLPPPNHVRTLMRKLIPGSAVSNIMTFYFRTHFTFTNDPGGMTLTASNLIDDGAIFYMNGRELTRVAMPEGPVTWNTTATRADLIGTNRIPTFTTHGYDVFSVPVDALAQGDNVMAVELHQASTSSTAAGFEMELWASYPTPTLLAITNEPKDVIVEETKPAVVRVGISGDGGHYQWYRQGVGPVPGAIAESYSVAAASLSDSGTYYAVITNLVNSVTTRSVQLLVVVDTNGPALVNADGSVANTSVLVTSSEALLATTATNLANYKITNTLGGTLTVTRAVLTNATNVLLTTSAGRIPNNNYILIASGIRDTSPRTNMMTANSKIPISNLATVIGLESQDWRYYDPYPPFDVADVGTAWKEINYTEVDVWGPGTGTFYNGIDEAAVPAPINTFLSQTPTVTTYFRHPLSGLAISPGGQKLFLTHIIDDGAVVYLNGAEIFRTNMPTGPVNYQTRSSTTVNNPSRIGPIALTNGTFVQGTNLIAVELHQASPGNLDKVFGMQIDAYVTSVAVGPAFITGGPSDVAAIEGQSATFNVMHAGGYAFQWQQNSNNIVGANFDTYVTAPVTLAMNGTKYRVSVTGSGGDVTSSNATLYVVADTNAPTLVSAYAGTNSILVSFSKSVSALSANNLGNYRVTNAAGQSFTITGAALNSATTVTLSFATLPPAIYFVVVSNVRDTSVAGNTILTNSTIKAGFDAEVIALTGLWRYNQATNDLTTQGWANVSYNDASWTGSGPGLLDGKSGGRTPATLPLPVGTVLLPPIDGPGGAYLNTVYFRTHFNSYGAGAGTLTFRAVLDDAAVIYLNGVEVNRIRISTGPVSYATQGSGTSVGDATFEGPFTIAVTNFVVGDNVIAVEVHQIGTSSSDVSWGAEFSAFIASSILPPASTNQPPSCPIVSFPAPSLRFLRTNGTNIILFWTNPVTNTCGSNAIFTLQQAVTLTDPTSSILWSNVTTVSPYTAIRTNNSRFFRIKL